MSEVKDSWLQPTEYIDYEDPLVADFVARVTKDVTRLQDKVVRLYYAVRDEIYYNPYCFEYNTAIFKASTTLKNQQAFCIPKAILFCAAMRAIGVPCRLGFADVKNHLSTQRLRETLRSDIYRMHGYVSLYLNNKWIKATPVFNIELCHRFGVKSLEFDGKEDSLLHPYDKKGDRHMEYLHDYGLFDDMPISLLITVYQTHYPHLFTPEIRQKLAQLNFAKEAAAENKNSD